LRPLICALSLSLAATFAQAQAPAKPVTTSSGLVYESLKEGTGASPAATDVVKVHYRGTLPDSGKEFDSSLQGLFIHSVRSR